MLGWPGSAQVRARFSYYFCFDAWVHIDPKSARGACVQGTSLDPPIMLTP